MARSSACTTLTSEQATPTRCSPQSPPRPNASRLGTGVIDMRYENPLYMAELAAMADLIAAGRLQLGGLPRFARIRDSGF